MLDQSRNLLAHSIVADADDGGLGRFNNLYQRHDAAFVPGIASIDFVHDYDAFLSVCAY